MAIALKDPIVDLAGWIFITWRKPFMLGDRIDIGGKSGDVVDIRAFQFSMMEVGNWVDGDARTGRVLHVPNGTVFRESVANTSGGWFKDVFHEIKVVITFESDWKRAKKLLEDIVGKVGRPRKAAVEAEVVDHAPAFLVMREELEPQVVLTVVDHGVCLTLRYLCEPRAGARPKARSGSRFCRPSGASTPSTLPTRRRAFSTTPPRGSKPRPRRSRPRPKFV